MKAPLPPNEAERLETLRGHDVLDTPPESDFDDLTLLAAQICQAPIALISLVDENRQWFKSAIGVDAKETSRDFAFCAHAILYSDEVLEVRDALLDPRFADNPLVTADPHIRFYAGAPLVAPDGLALGTLCVIDREPRALSAEQKAALRALSRNVIAQLELRRTLRACREVKDQLKSLNETLEQKVEARTSELQREMQARNDSELKFRQLSENIQEVFWMTDPAKEKMLYISPAYEQIWGRTVQSLYDSPRNWLDAIHAEDRQRVLHASLTKQVDGLYDEEYRIVRPNGEIRWIHDKAYPIRDSAGTVYRIAGVAEDITEHKLIESELRLSEQKFARAFHDNPDPMAISDLDTGLISEINKSFTKLFGYTKEEAIGRTTIEFGLWLDEVSRSEVMSIIKSKGYLHNHEVRQRTKDGRILTLLATTTQLHSSGTTSLVVHFRDITERKLAEQAAQDQKARLNALVESAMDAIVSTDENQNIIIFNHSAERMFGYRATEIIGQPLDLLIPIQYREKHTKYVDKFGWTGITTRTMNMPGQTYGLRANGEEFPFEASISSVKVSGKTIYTAILRDITERKMAEQSIISSANRLGESQRLLKAIVEHIPVMVFLKRASDLRFELFNRAGEELLGYSRSDLLGKGNYDLWPKEQGDWFTAADRKVLASKEVTVIPEEPINTASGEVRYLSTWKIALRDEDGAPTHLLGISIDITERKQAETDLRIAATAFESQESLMITDPKGVILRVNKAFTETPDIRPRKYWARHPACSNLVATMPSSTVRCGRLSIDTGTWQGEIWDRRKNGEIYPKWLSISAVKGSRRGCYPLCRIPYRHHGAQGRRREDPASCVL